MLNICGFILNKLQSYVEFFWLKMKRNIINRKKGLNDGEIKNFFVFLLYNL